MVLDYYKFAEAPFGVTPDTRFLYLSPTHREALASAIYGISSGRGFTALIASPGMGKTTILFELLGRIKQSAKTVFIFQTPSTPRDLLGSLLTDLGISYEGDDLTRMHSKLNAALLRESSFGRRLVIVIDEAQDLDEAVLEALRMLSNFETPREKLLHITGQPQLAEKLISNQLVQLRQRISIVSSLMPFDLKETQLYINHRLRVAGYDFVRPLFTERAVDRIFAASQGIPRNINNICFNALSFGCATKRQTIDVDIIEEVLKDLDLSVLFKTAAVAEREASPIVGKASKPAGAIFGESVLKWVLPLAALVILALWVSFAPAGSKSQASARREGAPSSQVGAIKDTPKTIAPTVTDVKNERYLTVRSGQTLREISVEALGKYNDEALLRLRSLNPWLTNPDHIEIGQKLRIPFAEATSPQIQSAAEHAVDAPAANPERK